MQLRTNPIPPANTTTIYIGTNANQLPADLALRETFRQLSPQSYALAIGEQGELRYCLKIEPSASYEKCLEAARKLSHNSWNHWSENLVLDNCLQENSNQQLSAIAAGLSQGRYKIGKWKSTAAADQSDFNLYLRRKGTLITDNSSSDPLLGGQGTDHSKLISAIRQSLILAEIELRIMDLVNAPANHKRPQDLAKWA